MNDYFDELETGLRDAVRRRAHLPWHARRLQLSVRHRGLAVVLASLVVATPAVAAVGAASGWFGRGSSPIYYQRPLTVASAKCRQKTGACSQSVWRTRTADRPGGYVWSRRREVRRASRSGVLWTARSASSGSTVPGTTTISSTRSNRTTSSRTSVVH